MASASAGVQPPSNPTVPTPATTPTSSKSSKTWGIRVKPNHRAPTDPRLKTALIAGSIIIPPLGVFNLFWFLEVHKKTTDLAEQLYYELVEKGYAIEADKILDANPGLLSQGFKSRRFVELCIETDTPEKVDYLIKRKASFASQNSEMPPLHYALERKKFRAFSAVLEAPDTDLGSVHPESGEPVLHVIARENHEKICESFLTKSRQNPQKHATVINQVDQVGRHAIFTALHHERLSIFRHLISERAADLTVKDPETHQTLFHAALEKTDGAYFSLLMDQLKSRKMNPNILDQTDDSKRTVAFVAAEMKKKRPEVQMLMRAGADLEAVHPESGETLLHVFTREGDATSCSIFIDEAKNRNILDRVIDKADFCGNRALSLAMPRSAKIVKQLIQEGADFAADGINLLKTRRFSPVFRQSQKYVKDACHGKIFVGNRPYTREQALFRCLQDGNFAQAKVHLCDSNTNLDDTDDEGNGPLLGVVKSEFSEKEKLALIKLIRSRGDDVNRKNASEESLLILAVKNNCPKIVKELTTKKVDQTKNVDLDQTDGRGNSALHHAAMLGRSTSASLLIEAGANVNLQNQDGRTPLHLVKSAEVETHLLLQGAANTSIQDKHGFEAVEIIGAQPRNDSLILELEKYDKKLSRQERLQIAGNEAGAMIVRAHQENGDIKKKDVLPLHLRRSSCPAAFARDMLKISADEGEKIAKKGVVKGMAATAKSAENIGGAALKVVEKTCVGILTTTTIPGRVADVLGGAVDKLTDRIKA